MKLNRQILLSGLAGAVAMFVLGFLYYGMIMMDFYANNTGSASGVMKETPDMLWLVISHIISGIVLAMLYYRWARGTHSAGQGFEFGAVVGLFTGFGWGFLMYATSNISNMTAVMADGVWQIIHMGLTGLVIAVVMKSVDKGEV
jgi:hypothetical protein